MRQYNREAARRSRERKRQDLGISHIYDAKKRKRDDEVKERLAGRKEGRNGRNGKSGKDERKEGRKEGGRGGRNEEKGELWT
jgi:hypothetical protein